MTLLHMSFEKAAVFFGWGNLLDFAMNLPQDSATWRSVHPEHAAFSSPIQQAEIIADIFDAVQSFAYMFARFCGGKPKQPKPYPRPWRVDGQQIGSGAIPIKDFNKWYYGGGE